MPDRALGMTFFADPMYLFQKRWKLLWLSAAAVSTMTFFMFFLGKYLLTIKILNYVFPFYNSDFQLWTVKFVGSFVLCVLFLSILFRTSRRLFRRVILSGIALYIVTFAIGSGNFLTQHFLLAIPFYATVFLLFIQNPKFMLPIVLMGLMPFFHPDVDYAKKVHAAQQYTQDLYQWEPVAKEADVLMDRCNFEQYYALGNAGAIKNFTMHSPTDLAYVELFGNPELRKRFIERIEMAPVIFTNDNYLETVADEDVRVTLQTHFTTIPPVCASDTSPGDRQYRVLFRTDPMNPGPPIQLPELTLGHFIRDLDSSSLVSVQRTNSIANIVGRELDIYGLEGHFTLNLEREGPNLRIVLLDEKNNILGNILLRRTDGKILSKSVAPGL